MRLTQHITNNGVLGAPPGATHEQCSAAPVTHLLYAEGTRCVRTYWQPTQEEQAAIAAGQPVWLEWWGTTMAPVAMGVHGCEGDALAHVGQAVPRV